MVLTDGEVWNLAELFDYVESQTSASTLGGGSGKGDIRVFTLGIGLDVSHGLIDGLARVGKGFSQVVLDEREGIDAKVMRMLRGALSVHVGDYRLEWEGKPSDEGAPAAPSVPGPSAPTPTAGPKNINLFDPSYIEPPHVISPPALPALPPFTPSQMLQAPYTVQPLFPFSRSTVYAILASPNVPPPTKVWLRGTTHSGDLLELEIPVQHSENGTGVKTIHQLAARKVLGELKDGTSYLHSKYKSVAGDMRAEGFKELVKREGVRVGLKYGVASEWTSFVAVVKNEGQQQQQQEGGRESGEEERDEAYDFMDVEDEIPAGKLFSTLPMTDITNNYFAARGHKARDAPISQPAVPAAPVMMITTSPAGYGAASSMPDPSIRIKRKGGRGGMDARSSMSKFGSFTSDPSKIPDPYFMPNAALKTAQPLSRTKALVDIQTYEGTFELDSELAALLGVSIKDLEAKLVAFNGGGLTQEQKRKVWATVIAIMVFETQLAGEKDVWGLVVDKARAWVSNMVENVEALEKLAGEVLGKMTT
jgi:hypothetical protein